MNSGMKTFAKRYRAWANKDEDNSEEGDIADDMSIDSEEEAGEEFMDVDED